MRRASFLLTYAKFVFLDNGARDGTNGNHESSVSPDPRHVSAPPPNPRRSPTPPHAMYHICEAPRLRRGPRGRKKQEMSKRLRVRNERVGTDRSLLHKSSSGALGCTFWCVCRGARTSAAARDVVACVCPIERRMTTSEQLARRARLAGRLMRRPSRRAARRQDVGLRLVWKSGGSARWHSDAVLDMRSIDPRS